MGTLRDTDKEEEQEIRAIRKIRAIRVQNSDALGGLVTEGYQGYVRESVV